MKGKASSDIGAKYGKPCVAPLPMERSKEQTGEAENSVNVAGSFRLSSSTNPRLSSDTRLQMNDSIPYAAIQ